MIGQTIRNVRKIKGLSLEDVANGTISTSFLSRVERGESRITVEDFFDVLERLNLGYEEFRFIKNHFNFTEEEATIDELMHAIYIKDRKIVENVKSKCLHIYENTNNMRFLHLYFLAYVSLCEIDEVQVDSKKLEPIVTYLVNCEGWTRYELNLFINFMFVLEPDIVKSLYDIVMKRIDKFWKVSNRYDGQIYHLLINFSNYFLDKNMPEDAYRCIVELEKRIKSSHLLFEKLHQKFLLGLWYIQTKECEKGKEICLTAIQTLDYFEIPHFVKSFKMELDKYMTLYA